MTNEELRIYWANRSKLTSWSLDAVDCDVFDADAKDLLVLVGLPVEAAWGIGFSSRPILRTVGSERFVVIGHDYEIPIAVSENDRRVYVLHDESPNGKRLVNTSVRHMATFLTHARDYCDRIASAEEGLVPSIVAGVATKMIDCDPEAMAMPESYWVLVLGQMRDGLL